MQRIPTWFTVGFLFAFAFSAAAATPTFSASPTSLTFTYQAASTNLPPAQEVSLSSDGAPISFTDSVATTTLGGWLSVSASGGTTPATVMVSVFPSGLAPGTYMGSVTFTPSGATNGALTVGVTLTITTSTTLSFSPNSISFNYQVGMPPPPSQSVTVLSTTPGVSFTTRSDSPFLTVSSGTGVTPVSLTLSVDPSGFTYPGMATAHVIVTAPGVSNSPLSLSVFLTITAAPTLQSSLPALGFAYQIGGPLPAPQILNISSSGTPLSFAASTTTPWLSVVGGGTTPGSITITANTAGLAAQTYTGSVTVAAAGSANKSVVLPVTLTISSQPSLMVSPLGLTFTSNVGGGAPAPQVVSVASTGGNLTYTLDHLDFGPGLNALSVTPLSGTTPGSFSVSVDPSGILVSGHFFGNVTITAAGAANSPVVIPVDFLLSPGPSLSAVPGVLSFNFQQGTTPPAPQQVDIVGSSPLNYTTTASTISGGSWLTISSPGGVTPAILMVSVNPAGLAPGSYSGTVMISAPGASFPLAVSLTITASATLSVSPTSMTFTYAAGDYLPPPSQRLYLGSAGLPISYSATVATTSGGNWLGVNPANGDSSAYVGVFIATTTQPAGTYNGTVTINGGGSAHTVAVTLVVTPFVPSIAATPTYLAFNYQTGNMPPPSQNVTVSSTGAPLSFTTTVYTDSGGNWLTVTPSSGTTPSVLKLSVAPGSLPVGAYGGSIYVSSAGAANGGYWLSVTFSVNSLPTPSAAPGSLSFTYQLGSSTLPSTQSVALASNGTPITLTAVTSTDSGGNWLTVSPATTTTPATDAVTVNPAGLAVGSYSGQISYYYGATGGPFLPVFVNLTVTAATTIAAAPSSVNFTYQAGSPTLPASQSMSLTSAGSPFSFSAAATTSSGGNWLHISPASGTTPGNVMLTVVPGGLAAGVYSGTVTVTAPGATNSPLLIPLTLTITAAPVLTAAPSSLNFSYNVGAMSPAGQTIAVSSGGSPLSYSAAETGGAWLSVSGGGTTPGSLTVNVNPAALSPGTYVGAVKLTASGAGNSPVSVPVTLQVTSTAPVASPASLTFTYQTGSAQPAPKTVALSSTAPVNFTAAVSGASWLKVTPASGTTPQTLTITAIPGTLAPGSYTASVSVVSAGSSPVLIPVSLSISPATVLTVSPGAFAFAYQLGGALPAAQILSLTSNGGGFTGAASASTAGSWLSVSSPAAATFSVAVNPFGLLAGVYSGSVKLVASAGNSPVFVPVTLTVSPTAALSVSPGSLSFNFSTGGPNPPTRSLALAAVNSPLGINVVTNAAWLTVAPPPGGSAPGALTVTANPAGLGSGTFHASIAITPVSGPLVTIPVELNIDSTAAPAVAAITNALSYSTGPIAPGELITIFGTGLGPAVADGLTLTPSGAVSSTIGDVRVLFDGIPAVLTLVWNKQVNAIVPYAIAGESSATVQLEYQGILSAPLVVPLASVSPGIASLDSSGAGEGAILNQDSSLNSAVNPASPGSVIVFFATGSGQSNPVGIDAIVPGSTVFTPVLPVTVSIGGLNALVLYAASAPGLVSGVLQVNAQIPSGVPPGSQPVLLNVGGIPSQSALTVLVK